MAITTEQKLRLALITKDKDRLANEVHALTEEICKITEKREALYKEYGDLASEETAILKTLEVAP